MVPNGNNIREWFSHCSKQGYFLECSKRVPGRLLGQNKVIIKNISSPLHPERTTHHLLQDWRFKRWTFFGESLNLFVFSRNSRASPWLLLKPTEDVEQCAEPEPRWMRHFSQGLASIGTISDGGTVTAATESAHLNSLRGRFLGNHLQCLSLKVILCSKFSQHLIVINRRQGGHHNVSQQDGQVNPDAPAHPDVVLKRN